jgi:hypothetical protein
MNRIAFVAAALFAVLVPAIVLADPSSQYNDPAMSFTAPAGFTPLAVPSHDPVQFEQPTVMAAYVKNGGKQEAMMITLQMDNFDGTLDGWETNTENTMRTQSDGVFIKKTRSQLANGMPAYWQEVTIGSGFDTMKRFEYVWVDGVRGITLGITAREGAIGEPDAKRYLANVSAVAFPKYRY